MNKIEYLTHELVSRHRGTLPLLLSCPHGGSADPPGILPRKGDVEGCDFEDDADLETRGITLMVAERLLELCGEAPYIVIAEYHRRYIDANRSRKCAFEVGEAAPYYEEYHRTLRMFVDEIRADHGGLGWLMDVHGARVLPEDPAAVYLGTAKGSSVQRLLGFDEQALFRRRSLRGLLTEAGYVVSPNEPAPFAGGFTVKTYGSSHADGIDAIQVEITAPVRGTEAARLAFVEQFARALAVLARERTQVVPQLSTGELRLVRDGGDQLVATLKTPPDRNDVQLRLGEGSRARGRLDLRNDAGDGPGTGRAGVLVLYDEDGKRHFLWVDPQGALHVDDHDPGNANANADLRGDANACQ